MNEFFEKVVIDGNKWRFVAKPSILKLWRRFERGGRKGKSARRRLLAMAREAKRIWNGRVVTVDVATIYAVAE